MESENEVLMVTGEQERENLKIRMKIVDMLVYALPLLERWSVAHQKMLGNKIADVMEDMVLLANELQFSPNKKTALKKLDIANKGLQDLVLTAYRLKYLKGVSSKHEWERRSMEIGSMIGGYSKWLYGEDEKKPSNQAQYKRSGVHGRRNSQRW